MADATKEWYSKEEKIIEMIAEKFAIEWGYYDPISWDDACLDEEKIIEMIAEKFATKEWYSKAARIAFEAISPIMEEMRLI